MLLQMIDYAPDILFPSSAFIVAFRAAMAALTLIQADIVFAALDFIRSVLTHDCLDPSLPSPPPKFPIYASAIRPVIEQEGAALVGCLLTGIVGDFPEDTLSAVVSILRAVSQLWTSQFLSWLPLILERLPASGVPHEAKTQFLSDITRSI